MLTVTDAPPAAAMLVRVTRPVPLDDSLARVIVGAEMLTVAGALPVPVRLTGEPVIVAPVAATVSKPL